MGLPPTGHISMVILETNPLISLESWFWANSWQEMSVHMCQCRDLSPSTSVFSFAQ